MAGATLTCDVCKDDVPEDEAESGLSGEPLCEYCYENYDVGTKYCCGMMYDNGESACRSCGEPL
jgi:hypothetical protein